MKKWILILGASILLIGCSSTSVKINSKGIHIEEIPFKEYNESKDMYINEDMKKVIIDINNLGEKYKDTLDKKHLDSLYLDLDDRYSERINDIVYENDSFYSGEYFNDIVEILDGSIAPGLKEFVNEMKNKDLEINDYTEIIVEKIGRTVVYVDDRGNDENKIAIKINFFDVENEYYGEVFNMISDDKYWLKDVVVGEELNLIDFVNLENDHKNYYTYHAEKIKIRYNMFFADENMKKVNILLQGKNGVDFKDEDIGVFINLLNTMDLNEEEKDLLVHEYKNVFKANVNKKKISLNNYDLYINYKKGNTSSGRPEELRYFSIERK